MPGMVGRGSRCPGRAMDGQDPDREIGVFFDKKRSTNTKKKTVFENMTPQKA
jgi:hypothetical protein